MFAIAMASLWTLRAVAAPLTQQQLAWPKARSKQGRLTRLRESSFCRALYQIGIYAAALIALLSIWI